MNTAFNNCPFCGAESGKHSLTEVDNTPVPVYRAVVGCLECFASVSATDADPQNAYALALQKWNRRFDKKNQTITYMQESSRYRIGRKAVLVSVRNHLISKKPDMVIKHTKSVKVIGVSQEGVTVIVPAEKGQDYRMFFDASLGYRNYTNGELTAVLFPSMDDLTEDLATGTLGKRLFLEKTLLDIQTPIFPYLPQELATKTTWELQRYLAAENKVTASSTYSQKRK